MASSGLSNGCGHTFARGATASHVSSRACCERRPSSPSVRYTQSAYLVMRVHMFRAALRNSVFLPGRGGCSTLCRSEACAARRVTTLSLQPYIQLYTYRYTMIHEHDA